MAPANRIEAAVKRLDAAWCSTVNSAMAEVQRLPERASQRLKSVSPKAAAFVKSVHVDSPLVLSIAAICLFVQLGIGEQTRQTLFAIGKTSTLTPSGAFRVVGQLFGHSSWSHLNGNLLLMLVAGPPVESAFGAARLSKIILWVAIATSGSHMLWGPAASVQLGASGVVFAFILLNSLLQRQAGSVPLTFLATCMLWLGGELLNPQTGTAHSAHLVGACVGTWFGHKVVVQKRWWGGWTRKIKD